MAYGMPGEQLTDTRERMPGESGGGDWWSQFGPQVGSGLFGTPNMPRINNGDSGQSVAPNPNGQPNAPGQTASIEQIKALVGNDYSPTHLTQILPQLKALGVEVQNQARGDLRPRFLLPGGEQWDFGPGGWINSGHGIQPGFGDASQAPGGSGSGGGLFGGGNGPLDTLRGTPGYQFALQQGLQGIERSAASRGTLLTGGTMKALAQYGTGLADQTYDASYRRYLDLAKLGQPQQPS